MKKALLFLLIATSGLITVNLLVACSKNGSTSKATGPSGPSPQSPGNPTSPDLGAEGTSTSGGGTGVNGKIFESHIVDPTKLPAYKEVVAPLLANIKADPADESDDLIQYQDIFKVKTWYIAPVELKKIKKELLGVSFLKSSTQQIARQTIKEVWIDKVVFDKMSTREQGELLVHELVMTMYLIKFMKFDEYCRMAARMSKGGKGSDCSHFPAYVERVLAPEPMRQLNDQDNENIRFVTGWLLQNAGKPISERDFIRILFDNGFDKRFFNPSNYMQDSSENKDLTLSSKELFQAIRGAVLTGNMPDQCSGFASGIKKACRIDVAKGAFSESQGSFHLRLIISGEAPINLTFAQGVDSTLSANSDMDGEVVYTLVLADYRSKVQLGDRLYSAMFFFRKSPASQASLSLESIIFKPGVIVSTDKKREPVCLLGVPKVKSILDDNIVAQREAGLRLSLSHQAFLDTPPFAACGPQNVDE